MIAWLLVPFIAQAAAMLVDEAVFHRRRGLSRFERLGHPIDSLSVALCYAWLVAARPSRAHALAYVGLATFSSLLVTKDEPVHARACSAGEHWLHALLFLLHPVVFAAAGYLWWTGQLGGVLPAQLELVSAFALYQLLYWNGPWQPALRAR